MRSLYQTDDPYFLFWKTIEIEQQLAMAGRNGNLDSTIMNLLRQSHRARIQGDYLNSRIIVQTCEPFSSPSVRMQLLRFYAIHDFELGHYQRGSNYARLALRMLLEQELYDQPFRAFITTLYAANEGFAGDSEKAHQLWALARIETSRVNRPAVTYFYCLCRAAYDMYVMNDIRSALVNAESAVYNAGLMEDARAEGCARSLLGDCHFHQLHLEDAKAELHQALDLLKRRIYLIQEIKTLNRLVAVYRHAGCDDTVNGLTSHLKQARRSLSTDAVGFQERSIYCLSEQGSQPSAA